MSVAVPSRLVEERNSSRNLSPVFRPVGLRPQFEGTSVGDGGQRAFDVHCQRVAVRVIDPVAPVVVAENVAEAPAGRHRILAIGGVGSQLGVGTRLPLKHQGVGRAGLEDRPLGGFQVPARALRCAPG